MLIAALLFIFMAAEDLGGLEVALCCVVGVGYAHVKDGGGAWTPEAMDAEVASEVGSSVGWRGRDGWFMSDCCRSGHLHG